MSGTRSLLLLVAASLGACQQPAAPADGGPGLGAAFSAPQGIAASDRFVLVTNTGFHYEGGKPAYHPGFVTVIDRRTRRVCGTIATSQRNPQELAVRGSMAYVVNGGLVRLDASGVARAVSDGALDVIDLSRGPCGERVDSATLGRSAADDRIGAYGSITLSPDGKLAFIGSGSRGDVFKVRLQPDLAVLRGPDDPIALFPTAADTNGLTVVRPFDKGLAVLNTNTDELCLSDDLAGDLARRTCGAVGVQQKLVEGPIDVTRAPDGRGLVLMTIANAVYRADLGVKPFTVEQGFAKTGLANNRLLVRGGQAYVLNSTSATLQRIDLATGASQLAFAVLPLKSNPYDMVITTEGAQELAWITLFGSHQVAVVDLTSGKLLGLISGAAGGDGGASDAGPSDAAPADAADAQVDALSVCPDAGGAPVKGIQNLIAASYGAGAGAGQTALPGVIQGGPAGSGGSSGSTDGVLSLGVKGEIVVDFGDVDVVDGPGPDLIVFENAFLVAPYTPYAEPAHVALCAGDPTDPTCFSEFPCDLTVTQGDATKKTWPYPGCAGVRPVQAGGASCVSPLDPALAGGDAFDLATLGLKQARYLRLRDAGVGTMGTDTKGFDLDAVVLINYKKR